MRLLDKAHYLSTDINTNDTLPKPITLLNANTLEVQENSAVWRNTAFLIGVFCVVLLSFWVNNFRLAWENREMVHVEHIKFVENFYGKNYFNRPNRQDEKAQWYGRLDSNMKMPFRMYLDSHYFSQWEARGRDQFYADAAYLSVLSISLLFCLIWSLRFRKRAPLIFDSRSQCAYTWRFGKVYACHWDSLRIYEGKGGITFLLYGEKPFYLRWFYKVYPSGFCFDARPIFNNAPLAYLFWYMEGGFHEVCEQKENTIWHRHHSFLFIDKAPKDLNERVNGILAR